MGKQYAWGQVNRWISKMIRKYGLDLYGPETFNQRIEFPAYLVWNEADVEWDVRVRDPGLVADSDYWCLGSTTDRFVAEMFVVAINEEFDDG